MKDYFYMNGNMNDFFFGSHLFCPPQIIYSVGKTSLMNRYHSNKFTGQYKATIGADFLSKQLTIQSTSSSSQKVTLAIWDTAGQERFQSLGNSFYRGADVCILVFDVNDRESFVGLNKWKDEFVRISLGGGKHVGFPFVVLGNKADKDPNTNNNAGTMEEQRQVSSQQAREWCQSNGNIPYFETSAKTALNVENSFVQAAKMGLEHSQKTKTETPFSSYGLGGGRPMRGYVPPHQQTVNLNHRQNGSSGGGFEQNGDCC